MFKKLLNWFDERLPVTATIERHLTKYPAPIGQNFWYLAGVLLIVVFVIQFLSGIWLLMNYEATSERAFASVQYIMRDVNYGWIIRYMHTTVESAHKNDVENVIKLIFESLQKIKNNQDFRYLK